MCSSVRACAHLSVWLCASLCARVRTSLCVSRIYIGRSRYSQEEADRAAGLMKETYAPIDREALAQKAFAAEAAKNAHVEPEDMDM